MAEIGATKERGTAVQVQLRTIYIGTAAIAVILGCAITALVLLFTREGTRSRRDEARAREPTLEPPLTRGSVAPPTVAPGPPRTPPNVTLTPPNVTPSTVTPRTVAPPVVTQPPVVTLPPVVPPPPPPPPRARGAGARFVYAPRTIDGVYAPFAPIFHDGQLARAVDAVNVYALNREVTITTDVSEGCAGGYDPATHVITLCVSHTVADLGLRVDVGADRDLATGEVHQTTVFLLLRGMGAALAQDLALPATGPSSDPGDEFAALVLAQNGRANECFVDVAALSQTRWTTGLAMSPERLERVVCLLIGADPTLDAPSIPVADASGCRAEYQRVDDLWTRSLEPFSRLSVAHGI